MIRNLIVAVVMTHCLAVLAADSLQDVKPPRHAGWRVCGGK
jgi:copper oxidase (laccase) domain-containing protein